MNNIGVIVLGVVFVILCVLALRRREDPQPIVRRFIEQFAKLVPRLVMALIGAGFIAQIIPSAAIASLMGPDAGLLALPIAAMAGMIVPAGPVIAFAIAAVFAKSGASVAALITFITAWSIFAGHRILAYELPLLGPSFFRIRLLSVVALPFVAGVFAMAVGLFATYGTPAPVLAP
jgi:uncharacterized membrane protein YraQ (UPF0718 family)